MRNREVLSYMSDLIFKELEEKDVNPISIHLYDKSSNYRMGRYVTLKVSWDDFHRAWKGFVAKEVKFTTFIRREIVYYMEGDKGNFEVNVYAEKDLPMEKAPTEMKVTI